jgi:integrase
MVFYCWLRAIRVVLSSLVALCLAVPALEWTDYSGNALNVKRSVLKGLVNQPKTRASAKPVPVIRQLAEILNTYRRSTGDPQSGVMFHSGAGQHMDFDKLARQVVRPIVESLNIDWCGWHGFRRGIASNLYELGADEKIVQRVLPNLTSRRIATSRRLTRRSWQR